MKKATLLLAMIFLAFSSCTKQTPKKETEAPAVPQITEKVIIETNQGDIVVGLYGDAVPETASNFLNYVKDGFYDGTIFHRVIKNFVIQGGGFSKDMVKKETRKPIKLEIHPKLRHDQHVLSMARTQDPNSATSQFFITLAKTPHLDPKDSSQTPSGYAVFGKVIEGQDVVRRIGLSKTENKGMYRDVPVTPVVIKKAFVIKHTAGREK